MRILLCSIYLPSGQDGVSNSTRQLVNSLEQKGVEVTVFTTDWGWTSDQVRNQRSEKLRIFPALFDNNFDCSLGMMQALQFACKNHMLIQFNSIYSFSTIVGAFYARRFRKPYLVCPQGNFIPQPGNDRSQGMRSATRKRIFFELFSRKAMVKADKVLCNSAREKEAVDSQMASNNFTYINNGIDAEPYFQWVDGGIIQERLGVDAKRPIFLFLGRLAEEKAIPFLLKVWDVVSQRLPEAILVLAGSSEHGSFEKIRKMVAQLALPDSVIMPGVIIGDLKVALLQKSRCLLLPSFFESFGVVVLEALASGSPVIASQGTPWKVLEEKGFGRWLPWNRDAWVEAVLELAKSQEYRGKSWSDHSRRWIKENYDWHQISEQYIQLYEAILKKR